MDEETFERELLQRRGFLIHRVSPDGNCLFRSVGMFLCHIRSQEPYI